MTDETTSAAPAEGRGIKHRWLQSRNRLRERPLADFSYRVGVAVVGLSVLFVGIAAIPYPGPGWAIVFLGLAILATEFYWARRTLTFTRARYDSAMAWFRGRPWWVQTVAAVLTGACVVATLWLFGVIAWSASLVGLEHPMLRSPIGLGA
jgi:uncharacterized protein (TIGR02611 family)